MTYLDDPSAPIPEKKKKKEDNLAKILREVGFDSESESEQKVPARNSDSSWSPGPIEEEMSKTSQRKAAPRASQKKSKNNGQAKANVLAAEADYRSAVNPSSSPLSDPPSTFKSPPEGLGPAGDSRVPHGSSTEKTSMTSTSLSSEQPPPRQPVKNFGKRKAGGTPTRQPTTRALMRDQTNVQRPSKIQKVESEAALQSTITSARRGGRPKKTSGVPEERLASADEPTVSPPREVWKGDDMTSERERPFQGPISDAMEEPTYEHTGSLKDMLFETWIPSDHCFEAAEEAMMSVSRMDMPLVIPLLGEPPSPQCDDGSELCHSSLLPENDPNVLPSRPMPSEIDSMSSSVPAAAASHPPAVCVNKHQNDKLHPMMDNTDSTRAQHNAIAQFTTSRKHRQDPDTPLLQAQSASCNAPGPTVLFSSQSRNGKMTGQGTEHRKPTQPRQSASERLWKQAMEDDTLPGLLGRIVSMLHRSLKTREHVIDNIAKEYRENALGLIRRLTSRHNAERDETSKSHKKAAESIKSAFVAAEKDLGELIESVRTLDVEQAAAAVRHPGFIKKLDLICRLYEERSKNSPVVAEMGVPGDTTGPSDEQDEVLVAGFQAKLNEKANHRNPTIERELLKLYAKAEMLLNGTVPEESEEILPKPMQDKPRKRKNTFYDVMEGMFDEMIDEMQRKPGNDRVDDAGMRANEPVDEMIVDDAKDAVSIHSDSSYRDD